MKRGEGNFLMAFKTRKSYAGQRFRPATIATAIDEAAAQRHRHYRVVQELPFDLSETAAAQELEIEGLRRRIALERDRALSRARQARQERPLGLVNGAVAPRPPPTTTLFQPAHVVYRDTAVVLDPDHAVHSQSGQLTAHRLVRNSKEIRDVGTR